MRPLLTILILLLALSAEAQNVKLKKAAMKGVIAAPAQPDPPVITRGDEVCGQYEFTITTPAAYPAGCTRWDIYYNDNGMGDVLLVENAGLSLVQPAGPSDAGTIVVWMRARNSGPNYTDSTTVVGP